MPPRVSTGDRDAVVRQIRWCAAVQTLVNCHGQLEENPVGSKVGTNGCRDVLSESRGYVDLCKNVGGSKLHSLLVK